MDTHTKILIVDDDQCLRSLLEILLDFSFAHVYVAEEGKSAMEMLRTVPGINLVITDLNMPIMDGIELTKQIRAHAEFNTIPIIMLSAEKEEFIAYAKQAGVDAFINKPYQTETLLAEIGRVIAKHT